MAVFVDDLFSTPKTKCWIHVSGCHMFGNDSCELHDLAHRIGLHPIWYRNHQPHGYYILNPARRKKAVDLGAVELTDEQCENFWKHGFPIFNSDIEIEGVK